MTDARAALHEYLRTGREPLVWKLDGLSEYDVRRPMTPTGTNLLGMLKHLAYVEMGYFGVTFGRPVAEAQPWLDDEVEPNADMWATAEESRDDVLALKGGRGRRPTPRSRNCRSTPRGRCPGGGRRGAASPCTGCSCT